MTKDSLGNNNQVFLGVNVLDIFVLITLLFQLARVMDGKDRPEGDGAAPPPQQHQHWIHWQRCNGEH
jgi:hypothetical protein